MYKSLIIPFFSPRHIYEKIFFALSHFLVELTRFSRVDIFVMMMLRGWSRYIHHFRIWFVVEEAQNWDVCLFSCPFLLFSLSHFVQRNFLSLLFLRAYKHRIYVALTQHPEAPFSFMGTLFFLTTNLLRARFDIFHTVAFHSRYETIFMKIFKIFLWNF